VDNGYGGQVGFEYETVDYFTHAITGLDQYGTEIIVGQCGTEGTDRWQVATRTITPTLGGQPAVYQYAYTPAFDPSQDFRGHQFVDVTVPTGDVTAYTFSLGKYDPAARPDCTPIEAEEPKWGRPLQVTLFDAGQQLSNVETDYAVVETVSGVHFVAPAAITATLAGASSTVVTYTYNADTAQVTAIGEWGFADDPDDGRVTTIDYAYTWAGIHTLPDRVQVRDEAGGLLAATDYHYLMLPGRPVGAIASASITRTDVVSGVDLVTSIGYDDYGNMDTYRTGPDGTFSIEYEALHHTFPVTVTYPLAGAEATSYDPATGLPESVTDLNGNTTSYDYDGFGRLETLTEPHPDYPTGVQTDYTYSDINQAATAGLGITVTQAANTPQPFITTTEYDGLGRLVREARPGATGWIYTRREYDGLDRLWRVSLPYTATANAWNETTYDALGRPETVSAPGAGTTTYQYDGATVRVIDANQHVKEYDLTAFGAAAVTREYTGTAASPTLYATTTYGYDPLGNQTTITDAQSNATLIGYDGLGRVIAQDDPDMGHWRYEYDADGNLWRQTDARGVVTTLTYDALDRLTGKSYDTGAAPDVAATAPVTYTYDQGLNGKGRRTGMMDGSGSTSWDYDPAGQVLTETQAIAGQSYVTGYRYDALRSGPNGLGRLARMIYPDGEVVTTTYNTQGLPETVAGDDVYLAHAGYNALDQPTGWALGGVLTQALSYDPGTFRLNGLSAANAGGATLQSLDLAFDPLGRLDLYTDHLAGFSLDPTYDPLNRLAGVTSGDYPQDYQYDTIGNLLQRDLLELTYAHASKPHAVTEVFDGQTEDWYQYTYDDNGNRRQRLGGLNDVAYAYDAENRLVKVEESSQVTSFGYDGAGQRVTRLGPGGERTTYAGDHYQLTITGKWSDNVAIYGETGDWQMTPNMVSAADGTLYLVWIEWIEYPQQPGLFQVQFTKRDPAGSWSTPELVREVVEFDYDLFYPAVVVDPAGNVTVAWEEYNPTLADSNIRVRQRDATGSWGSMETVADSSADEKRPSLTAAPDGSVYLAWYRVDAYNQAAVEVARKPISASWTITYQTGNNPVHFLPALTSDSQGNVYLAYVVGYGDMSVPEGDLYIVRREAVSATWAISPELVSDAPHYFWSEDPPALAADSQDNLYVAWGGTIDSSVLLRQRVATTGEWELIQELDAPQSSGLDLVMDGNGVPQWIAGDPRDDSWLPIWVNDVNIVDDDVYHSQYPTLAVGPNGALVAVWEGDWNLSYQRRLFTATYNPAGIVTKHYHAGGQRLATRVDGVLYPSLPGGSRGRLHRPTRPGRRWR
jgi:YD repeat-containing protein